MQLELLLLLLLKLNICNIPVIALTDSNCDPTPIDLVIPGNDDAKRGIKLILDEIVSSVLEGQNAFEAKKSDSSKAAAVEEVAVEATETVETTETETTGTVEA